MNTTQRLGLLKTVLEGLDYQVDGRIPITDASHQALSYIRTALEYIHAILEAEFGKPDPVIAEVQP